MAELDWLTTRLPPIEKILVGSEPDYYGATHLIALQLGKTIPPESVVASWMHGWQYNREIVHPRQVVSYGGPRDRHLVARGLEVELLKEFGFTRVTAVGLPFIYADRVAVKRKPNSLLVMPAHSLPYTKHKWDEQAYVEEITRSKGRFAEIVACISMACVNNGYWTHTFEKAGIPWIAGACVDDKNALVRMNCLFKTFEYVTTNSIGSHIAYAAYSGCKVSIFGAYVGLERDAFENDPWYRENPDLLESSLEATQETTVRAGYPEFFTAPHEASQRTEWGREMVGARHRKTPRELARLLGWSAGPQLAIYLQRQMALTCNKLALRSTMRRFAGALFK
jgi:hypothetical protein